MPAPWHSVILMINVRSPVCFRHLEQQLNRDTEDKPSVRVTAERRPAPLMLKPCLFDMYYRSLILCKFEIRSPLNVVLPAATRSLKQTLITQRASWSDICLLPGPGEKGPLSTRVKRIHY